jgi:hypothetical protein
MTSMKSGFGIFGGFALLSVLLAAPAAASFKCLPTCSTTDGRFLAIAGTGLDTLSPPELELAISVPAGSTSFDIGIFDGDGGEYDPPGDPNGNANWDSGLTALFEYELFADPDADGVGLIPVDLEPGEPTIFSPDMPDNAWRDFTVPTGPDALSPSGNYFYVLRIRLVVPTLITLNSFKVRTTAVLSGLTLDPVERPFSYIAPWTALSDLEVIYPNFPDTTPTTYDGTFRFYFDVPVSQNTITLWDGDFDHGSFDGSTLDTDDPDTPLLFLPPWATLETLPETAKGIGSPSDDTSGEDFGAYILRTPSVRYDVVAPGGTVYANDNPSGNVEWERFTLSTDPFDPSEMDYSVPGLPPGTYALEIQGVDMLNLNALLLPFRVLCVDETGVPCVPLRPFLVGDTVFFDEDGDGTQDPGEPGIAGVEMELYDDNGFLIGTTTTDTDGNYSFGVDNATYEVRVAEDNFTSGPLAGYQSTTGGDSQTDTVDGDNELGYDFGYRGTGSIGDRVWNDTDGDGTQDGGEAGLNGVTVELLDGDGNVVDTTTTSGDGDYSFDNLGSGTFTVRIVSSTLPAGFSPTFDADGTGTPHEATVTLGSGDTNEDVDFGYQGSGSVGDRIWSDLDGDGVQEGGEPGLNGVTVRLIDGGGNTVATTVTAGDGNYSFTNVAPGTYTVSVDSGTLPAGFNPTFDRDGIGTPNQASVTVAAGDNLVNVDFGYRATPKISLGDRVWSDADGDGVQDGTETGLNGVTVQLLNSGGTVIATQVTAGNGNYSFANLDAGTYSVRVVSATLPAGSTPTFDADGTGTPHIATVNNATANNANIDFGYRQLISIGDRVWNDGDADGVQDGNETGLNGITVQLLNSGGTVIATQVTAGNGNYSFTNLAPGTYSVRVVSSTLPAGSTPTYDADGTATPHIVTGTATTSYDIIDFGYRPAASCTEGYFKDHFNSNSFSNNDGTLSWAGAWIESDSAGSGVSSGNVTVGTPVSGYMILNDSPDTGTQPSAARQANLSGFASATLTVDFHIRGVEPDDAAVIEVSKDGGATYTVLETLTGYTGTYDSSRTYNISAYRASNTRVRFRISQNYGGDDDFFKVDWVKLDAGCTPSSTTGSIGNRVWKDVDGDGAQDSGEPGLNGVTVQLLNSGGTVIATQTTSGDGNYSFSGLAAATYKVKVVSSSLPSGYTQTYDLDGTGTAHIATVALTAGQNRTDADFGYRPPQSCTAGYFKDHFNSNSFSNNDGSLSWSAAWVESDTAGSGVSSGNVTVGTPVSGYMILRDSPDTGTQPSAARQANLSSFASATLTVDFHIRGVESDDAVVIEVSKDGGSTYTVLETLTGYTGTYESSRTYNISAYRASNTRVRFRIKTGYGGSDDFFKVDWVKLDGGC